MIRLGLRLALAGGRWSLVPTLLAAVAVGFGTAILLFALSFEPALQARYDHEAWRETPGSVDGTGTSAAPSTLLSLTADFVAGRPLARIDLAAVGAGAPVPPGIPRLPAPGEAFVSPELGRLLVTTPPDQLGNRFGRIVGEIGEAGLAAPDELAVVEGLPAAQLRSAGSREVTAFDTKGGLPAMNIILFLIVALAVVGAIAPVAVFVATATRLAAARRERRLVALRLSGATPRQVAVLGVVDALIIAVPGAVLGVGLFALLRPAVAQFELGSLAWFPEAIAPPIVPAVALVAAVPVVGVVAAVVALRRMAISPLGVARRTRTGPLSRLRLVPLVASTIAFVAAVALGPTYLPDVFVLVVAGAFFGIIVGIVIAGPWITSLVGRLVASGGGPVRLLAGSHLLDDPRAAFGSVAGVVMAVFVASVFFGFVAYTRDVSGAIRVPVRPSSIAVAVPGGEGAAADAVVPTVERMAGVRSVAVIREAAVVDPAHPDEPGSIAWIVSCDALLGAGDIAGATCGPSPVHLIGGATLPAGGVVLAGPPPDAARSDFDARTARADLVGAPAADRLRFEDAAFLAVVGRASLPDVLVEPSAVAGGGSAIRPLLLLVATNGDPVVIERVRTILEAALPTSAPATGSELAASVTKIIDELTRVVSLGVVLTLLVAGCSLAVAVAGGLLDRRRPFALLRMAGTPVARLRAVLVVEAAAPLLSIAVLSAVLGVAVSQLVLRIAGVPAVPLPDASVAILLVGSVGGALAVVATVLPLVGTVTALEETRFE